MAVNICVFINISCRPEIRQCLCRPRNADGADPFRPLPERRLHRAERAGSEPFIMAAPILSYESLGLVQGSGWLFRGLDLYLGARDRLALIGRNGAGTKIGRESCGDRVCQSV